jgi:SAM-dependent methyltransferase
MGGIEQNERQWGAYAWSAEGDEWSIRWGGPDYQWFGSLLPRLREFLPAGTILEIAPGFGRWTHYLVHLCDRLIGVELTARCVEACRERFGDQPHATFHKNDGMSLDMVPDGEVDFAFSFDSLVHCESDVVESYVHQLARKLRPDGVAFIHHSNLAAYVDPETGRLPFPKGGWRAESVSADLFERLCREAGLLCIGQELLKWRKRDPWLGDCISMLARPDTRFARENRIQENPDFWAEATALARVADLYGSQGFPQLEGSAAGMDALSLLRRSRLKAGPRRAARVASAQPPPE